MKKILFILLLSVFMIPNVNVYASTAITDPFEHGLTILPQSCSDNILKVSFSNLTFNGSWRLLDETDLSSSNFYYFVNDFLIEIEPNTTYWHISVGNSYSRGFRVCYFDENLNYLSCKTSSNNRGITTLPNAKYLLFGVYGTPSSRKEFLSFNHTLTKNSTLTSHVDYEQCPVITVDTTLDNFYSIYVTKLKELSNFTIENKFVLSAFVIVLIFGLLASFIYLFFGRRKN